MKFPSFFLVFLFHFLVSSGQSIPDGRYIGYEQNPFCYKKDCILVHDTLTKTPKNNWYYRVTLTVTDTLISLEKMPVYFYSNPESGSYTDSTVGGYYSYKVTTGSGKVGTTIFGHLQNCKYCKPCAEECRYMWIFYVFRKKEADLLMDEESEKNILFERQYEE